MAKQFVIFDNYNNEEDEYTWDDIMYDLRGIETENKIICIADLGLWNGRHKAYKLLDNKLLSAMFVERSCDYAKFWIDGYGNLRSKQMHHDGTNLLLFRELKQHEDTAAMQNFMRKIYNGEVTSADITRNTRALGVYFKKIYNI